MQRIGPDRARAASPIGSPTTSWSRTALRKRYYTWGAAALRSPPRVVAQMLDRRRRDGPLDELSATELGHPRRHGRGQDRPGDRGRSRDQRTRHAALHSMRLQQARSPGRRSRDIAECGRPHVPPRAGELRPRARADAPGAGACERTQLPLPEQSSLAEGSVRIGWRCRLGRGPASGTQLRAAGLARLQARSELWTGTIGARRAWTVSMISVLSIPCR